MNRHLLHPLGMLLVVACPPEPQGLAGTQSSLSCNIPVAFIADGGPGRDGIPALSNPTLVDPSHASASYLLDHDRVIGFVVDGKPIAVPLNIQWWHEIANFTIGTHRLAVTHCPLTGSSLIFYRQGATEAEFGVSGLLYLNNLMMYDRTTTSSLWPQMSLGATCGPKTGAALETYPAIEITWAGWRALHPSTQVVSSETGFFRDYRAYPYVGYDLPGNESLLFPMPFLDKRRPPKERVLGIPDQSDGGAAFPYGALDQQGPAAVVPFTVGGEEVVVFWSRAYQAASAFLATTPDRSFTFTVDGNRIVDVETGSEWRVDGFAITGPLAGTQLEPVTDAYVAYWFAWAGFHPKAELWTGNPAASP